MSLPTIGDIHVYGVGMWEVYEVLEEDLIATAWYARRRYTNAILLNDDYNSGLTELQINICLSALKSAKKKIAKMAPHA